MRCPGPAPESTPRPDHPRDRPSRLRTSPTMPSDGNSPKHHNKNSAARAAIRPGRAGPVRLHRTMHHKQDARILMMRARASTRRLEASSIQCTSSIEEQKGSLARPQLHNLQGQGNQCFLSQLGGESGNGGVVAGAGDQPAKANAPASGVSARRWLSANAQSVRRHSVCLPQPAQREDLTGNCPPLRHRPHPGLYFAHAHRRLHALALGILQETTGPWLLPTPASPSTREQTPRWSSDTSASAACIWASSAVRPSSRLGGKDAVFIAGEVALAFHHKDRKGFALAFETHGPQRPHLKTLVHQFRHPLADQICPGSALDISRAATFVSSPSTP